MFDRLLIYKRMVMKTNDLTEVKSKQDKYAKFLKISVRFSQVEYFAFVFFRFTYKTNENLSNYVFIEKEN